MRRFKKPKRVGVLMGGPSCERDISLKSGLAVCRALDKSGIEAVPVEILEATSPNGYNKIVADIVKSARIDVAFIALHGEFGEDGTIQKILEDMDMPYTGSKVMASRAGMDKIISKNIFKSQDIPMPRHIVLDKKQFDRGLNARDYFKKLGDPLVIKPSDEGSSIGLSIVDLPDDFNSAIANAFNFSGHVIVEEYIEGREITVGILEDRALPVVEIIPKNRFFDFQAKYQKGLTEYVVPARIEKKLYSTSQKIALSAHKALGARFFSRVDMIVPENGVPVVLEVNTIPGLTEMSLLPKAAKAAGIGFKQLVLKILESSKW